MLRIIIGMFFLVAVLIGIVNGDTNGGLVLALIIGGAFIAWGTSARNRTKREERRDELLTKMLEDEEKRRRERND